VVRRAPAAAGAGLFFGAALVLPAALVAAGFDLPCRGVRLRDVTSEAGLSFAHARGARGEWHLPETMGAGLAWVDFDGDGWLDLYVVQSGPFPPTTAAREPDRLFRNRGDGTFEDWSDRAGAHDRGYGQGVVAVDADGDGDADLLLTGFDAVALLLNEGDGTYRQAGPGVGLLAGGWSSSAAFADADGDGDLDLYVARYVRYDPAQELVCTDPRSGARSYCDPTLFEGERDLFYRRRDDGGYDEVGESLGLGGGRGRGLGVLFLDLDGDRWPDLYVANDLTPNLLFRNRGGLGFEDLSLVSGAAVDWAGQPEAGMGLAVADVDGDGLPDLAVTNFDVETNTLYRNLGGMLFADVAAASGFGPPSFNLLGFGIVSADFDGDGDADFYVANGHIFDPPRRDTVTYAQPDLLLLGDGAGRFHAEACGVAAAGPQVGRGAAVADYDEDGDPDVAVSSNGGPLVLLRNDTAPRPWLGVRLRGGGLNGEAIGARVTLRTRAAAPQTRWVVAGDSYQSSSDRRPLFGWRDGDHPEELEVVWPSGRVQRWRGLPAGRYAVLYGAQ
jgi:enediyne biosynthesis protein E4